MDSRTQSIVTTAAVLGVDPSWLDAVIAFESGYDPLAVAHMPYNQAKVDKGLEEPKYARGLIQFIDSTAQALGFADSADLVARLPDFASQMQGAVLPYFKRLAPFVNEQDFYMSVFYPAYRHADPYASFPDSVQRANPGITTPADYVEMVNRRVASKRLLTSASLGIGAMAAAGIAAWWFLKG